MTTAVRTRNPTRKIYLYLEFISQLKQIWGGWNWEAVGISLWEWSMIGKISIVVYQHQQKKKKSYKGYGKGVNAAREARRVAAWIGVQEASPHGAYFNDDEWWLKLM
jgi:hypothetical protein